MRHLTRILVGEGVKAPIIMFFTIVIAVAFLIIVRRALAPKACFRTFRVAFSWFLRVSRDASKEKSTFL